MNENTAENNQESAGEKTFTESEVNSMIEQRIAKVREGMPSADELTAYRTWKDSQQTEKERQEKREKELAASKSALSSAQAELEQLKRDKYVLSKGLSGEEAEFITFKAAKMADDKTTFEQAVDQIIKSRHKVRFDWTAPVGEGQKESSINNAMNDLIRGALKK